METIKFLKKYGLEKLKENFLINTREENNLIILNYSIFSPMDQIICQECRNLILERDTWNIISASFPKFFNYNEPLGKEVLEQFNFPCFGYIKHDGSLVSLYYYNNQWNFSTKSKITPDPHFKSLLQTASKNIDFSQLNKSYTYVYELVSPSNQIVVFYEETKLILIGVFEKKDSRVIEHTVQDPLRLSFISIEDAVNYVEKLDPIKQEGLVLVDIYKKRLKVKSSKYILIHRHVTNLLSTSKIIELILSDNFDDLYDNIKYIKELKDRVDNIKKLIEEWTRVTLHFYHQNKDLIRKDYALLVQSRHNINQPLAFNLMNTNGDLEKSIKTLFPKVFIDYIEKHDDVDYTVRYEDFYIVEHKKYPKTFNGHGKTLQEAMFLYKESIDLYKEER